MKFLLWKWQSWRVIGFRPFREFWWWYCVCYYSIRLPEVSGWASLVGYWSDPFPDRRSWLLSSTIGIGFAVSANKGCFFRLLPLRARRLLCLRSILATGLYCELSGFWACEKRGFVCLWRKPTVVWVLFRVEMRSLWGVSSTSGEEGLVSKYLWLFLIKISLIGI